MKLHDLLDDIFGSKSKVRILRLLVRYQGREFTEREIARHIGMSQNTVNRTLGDLSKTNALVFRSIGRANVYTVNKTSVLFPFLQSIFKGEKRIREDLIKKLRNAASAFVSCTLFGSFAHNSESHDSDLDLLVIVKDKKKAKSRLDELQGELLKLYGIPVSIVLLTPQELINKWNAPYMKQARRTGITICGKPIEELHGEGSKN